MKLDEIEPLEQACKMVGICPIKNVRCYIEEKLEEESEDIKMLKKTIPCINVVKIQLKIRNVVQNRLK